MPDKLVVACCFQHFVLVFLLKRLVANLFLFSKVCEMKAGTSCQVEINFSISISDEI